MGLGPGRKLKMSEESTFVILHLMKTLMCAQPLCGRGLHSSTYRLNLSALYGIGGARRDCVARMKGA